MLKAAIYGIPIPRARKRDVAAPLFFNPAGSQFSRPDSQTVKQRVGGREGYVASPFVPYAHRGTTALPKKQKNI